MSECNASKYVWNPGDVLHKTEYGDTYVMGANLRNPTSPASSQFSHAIKFISHKYLYNRTKDEKIVHDYLRTRHREQRDRIMLVVEYFDLENFTCLVFPFASGGNLYNKMKSTLVSEKDIAIDLREALLAIKQLHDANVIHRDVKPENFLFMGRKLVISDLGSAYIDDENYEVDLKNKQITEIYLAPEAMPHDDEPRVVSKKGDIFPIGMMAVEWLIGRHPYLHDNEEKEIRLIEEHPVDFDRRFRNDWKNITPQGQRFIKETTCVEKGKRLDVDGALGHEWFKLIEKPDGEVPERFLKKTHRVVQDQVRREVKRIRFNKKRWMFEITVSPTSTIGRMLGGRKQHRQSSRSSPRQSNASSHHSTRSTGVGEKKGPSRLQKRRAKNGQTQK